ncbi:MAG: hypothetical protein LBD95_03910 [Clostridiales Family XIII bacterium]|jgi:hypothetical protein|nr:hypothetical protein [Clostridiales Family XIII bacterium]
MACFLVPTAEAIVATVIRKTIPKEKETGASTDASAEQDAKIPFSRKLKWLTNLLWGGSVLLAFEHVWHGEVTPWFPFLTAAKDPGDTAEMLHEMGTAGVSMAIIVTLVWLGMVIVANAMEKKELKARPAAR